MTAINNRSGGGVQSVPAPPPGHSETCCAGQAHGQGTLALQWPDKRTDEQKAHDKRETRREHDEDNRREWYE
jgi:hypothetical protein